MAMEMDDSAVDIKPINDRVLIKFTPVDEKEELTQRDSGLFIPGKKNKAGQAYGGAMGKKHRAYIYAVGKDVNLEEQEFDIGDWVLFNSMDVMAIDMPDPNDPTETITFGMTKPESIWGLYIEDKKEDKKK